MEPRHHKLITELPKINEIVLRAIEFCNKDAGSRKRGGGYLVIMDSVTGELIIVMAVGYFPVAKTKKYLKFALGKAFQLFIHRGKHMTSFESKEGDFPQGAVLLGEYIFSFSGQTSEADEAIAALIAERSIHCQNNLTKASLSRVNLRDALTLTTENKTFFALDAAIAA